jgi:hypothetical protein
MYNNEQDMMSYLKRLIENFDTDTAYTREDFETFESWDLFEAESDWEVSRSRAFRTGFKKHRNNKKIMDEFNKLIDFIKSHNTIPALDSYPIEYNAHRLHASNRVHSPSTIQFHLLGTKIILIAEVLPAADKKSKNHIKLIHLGTHQEAGQC